ncbi:uncharacterized protein LOC129299146 [Prosopis cineraria]|uniref:uncharacterized protein LOC129299146 n=1 Tax=Prosopis cineraria TaxID=364024 RepID=UPI00240F06EB|nr:uncharacterized protein LOC129299146 [Prosopis cineraria]
MDVDASLTNNNNAACGGLAKNTKGEWIRGFTYNLGNFPINIAEIKAIQFGVETCRSMNIEKAHIFSNSLNDLNFVYKGVLSSHPFYDEIRAVQNLAITKKDYKILYAPHEAALCANFLAKQGHHHACELIQLFEIPKKCEAYLLIDKSGTMPIACNLL